MLKNCADSLGVDYVRFTVCDFNGIPRVKLVHKDRLLKLDNQVSFYTHTLGYGTRSSITVNPAGDDSHGNVTAYIVSDIVKVSEKVCEGLCDTTYSSGLDQRESPRYIASKLESLLFQETGLKIMSAFEYEFRVFQNDIPVFTGNDIFNGFVLSKHEKMITELESYLRMRNVTVETMQTEFGDGQFEFTLIPLFGVESADMAFRLKTGVKEFMQRTPGRLASFMTKPIFNQTGNSGHFNHSLWDGEENIMASEEGISDIGKWWLGGLIQHAEALTALSNPTINCYRRLHGPWAPKSPNYGFDNRSTMVRILPQGYVNMYFESRLPGSACNPYLTLAAHIAAGMDGIRNQIDPDQLDTTFALPETLEQSLACLQEDTIVVEALGHDFVAWYCDAKVTEMESIIAYCDDNVTSRFTAEKHFYQEFL